MVDTNVLVYAIDTDSGDKHRRAIELIQRLIDQDLLAVSVQVLNEFYAAATRPRKPFSLSHERASKSIRELVASSAVLPLTAAVTVRAIEAMPRHGFSFWDALIWAAAKENGIAVLYTEDFQDGRDIEDVRIVNPFAAEGPGATRATGDLP